MAVRESLLAKRSAVSERFSKGSLRRGVSRRFPTGFFLGGRGREWEEGGEEVSKEEEKRGGVGRNSWTYSSIAARNEASRLYAFLSLPMSWPSKMQTSGLPCRSTRTRRKISPR